tara:strand:+ start:298 stop:1128 length:831 start_codon:yes stop_codon:yes gene_type:complete
MPFIGTTPTQGFVSSFPKQSFTPNGSTTVFTLTNPVASANDLEVFVGNVRQEPTTAYTAAGTTLTMSEAPDTGLNFYVINKSFAQVTTTPPANSISTDKIVNSAVTDAKIGGVAATKLSGTVNIGRLPSGSPIQVVSHNLSDGGSTTSSTAVALVTLGAITTTQAGSKIILQTDIPTQLASEGNTKAVYSVRHSVDSYASVLNQQVAVRYADGGSNRGWTQSTNNFIALHTHGQSVGTTITYKIYGLRNSGSQGIYVLDEWGLTGANKVILTEIVG